MSPYAVNHTQISWSWKKMFRRAGWWRNCVMGGWTMLFSLLVFSGTVQDSCDSLLSARFTYRSLLQMFCQNDWDVLSLTSCYNSDRYLSFKKTPHSIWRCNLGRLTVRQTRLFVVQQCAAVVTVVWDTSLEQNMWIFIPNTVWHLTMQSCLLKHN